MVMVQCFVILEVYSAGLVHETETIDTTKGWTLKFHHQG